MESKVEELFRHCDKGGTGVIGREELRELCSEYGIKGEDAEAIFSDLDHDGDGIISREDFEHGFRDFLTPGSRRGSLQLPLDHIQQLREMERRHNTARKAWTTLTNQLNVGVISSSNKGVKKNRKMSQLDGILEVIEKAERKSSSSPPNDAKIENAISILISDVQRLQEEYKGLENSFKKEREVHAFQIASLGEELDSQLAKAEAKAKTEARLEAQKQMDSERKKIVKEMEVQISDLSSQLMTFKKVEEWLGKSTEGQGPYEGQGEFPFPQGTRNRDAISGKLVKAEEENRSLKNALVEAQMKATVLQTQLQQKKNDYLELCNELQSEKMSSAGFKSQMDLMQNHVTVLSDANRVLNDANDCFSSMAFIPIPGSRAHSHYSRSNPNSGHSSLQSHHSETRGSQVNCSDGYTEILKLLDSGKGTLFDELLKEGEGSPLPSGVWGPMAPSMSMQLPPTPQVTLTAPVERTFKVILAGESAVGKTSFIERVCSGTFIPNLSSTIGVDFRVKSVSLEGVPVALQLWDTAGQERFRALTKSYFRRADGVILMFDVTNEKTFLAIRHWVVNVEEGAGRKLPLVLCGNKSDLRTGSSSCVRTEDGEKLASECGAVFLETSPKTGHNVIEALVLLAKEMSLLEDTELKNSMTLAVSESPGGKGKGCCGGNAN